MGPVDWEWDGESLSKDSVTEMSQIPLVQELSQMAPSESLVDPTLEGVIER
jgi:hypothetical protein